MVDLHDAGMLQPGDRLGLGAEPRRRHRAGVRAGQNHLERAWPVQGELPRQVDDAHAAAAQLAAHLVASRPQRIESGRSDLGPREHRAELGIPNRLAAQPEAREDSVDAALILRKSLAIGGGFRPRAAGKQELELDGQQPLKKLRSRRLRNIVQKRCHIGPLARAQAASNRSHT